MPSTIMANSCQLEHHDTLSGRKGESFHPPTLAMRGLPRMAKTIMRGNIYLFQSPASHGGLCIAGHRRASASTQIDPDHILSSHSKRDDLQDTFLDAVEVKRPTVVFKKKLWNSA
ncbi:uncharacterized protein FIESC28_02831 [Fusarium coffeatum]|uniref:Uncharacterized protein n=1 Tax=Fusarium coffeatum TaxID=231269 RepID=A0A366S4T1_9HYPO|nr:uncharacterized protein FIESC28_02831 [Fusarium coffeatum]RBR24341.1 hypothetical protein FIESC28_02831 [Fusarium coffeatum]